MRRLTISCLLMLLIALLALTGTGCGRPKKKRFNNMIARTNLDLKTRAKAFYKIIKPLGEGKPIIAAEARSSLLGIESTLKEVRKTYFKLDPPANSPAGETLMEKYRAFIKAEEEIIETCLRPIVVIAEDDRTYPTPAAKWDAIAPLLKKADELEKEPFRALASAQKDYAEAHKYKLVQ